MKTITKIATTIMMAAGISATAQAWERGPVNSPDLDYIYAGSGCVGGGVTMNNPFELEIDVAGMEVQAGSRFAREHCQYLVEIEKPYGWTYGVVAIESAGFSALSSGQRGRISLSTYIQGQSGTFAVSESTSGFGYVDVAGHSYDPDYAPCGLDRALNIKTSLSVYSRGSRWGSRGGSIEMIDSVKVILDWKPCY